MTETFAQGDSVRLQLRRVPMELNAAVWTSLATTTMLWGRLLETRQTFSSCLVAFLLDATSPPMIAM